MPRKKKDVNAVDIDMEKAIKLGQQAEDFRSCEFYKTMTEDAEDELNAQLLSLQKGDNDGFDAIMAEKHAIYSMKLRVGRYVENGIKAVEKLNKKQKMK